ncbi:uncharacterized protein LOC106179269 [Lingula anatina]|uniref:Uncharacterized protein LOC106179269 n=1 Tax=Lingula anatina TaxID=7574 RepID=A0A1S3K6Z2_LINAN|nr:uncharacterized protein LOC106179269 [Lingula anatina]|eukprot:XP_013418267.1 uncharacterized protein LOC106179269 [Lingula anatina]
MDDNDTLLKYHFSGSDNKSVPTHDTILPAPVLKGLEDYYVPCLAAIGCCVNLISSVIFSRNTTLRRFSSSHYLAAVTAADTGFMMTLLIMWLPRIHISFYLEEGFCQLFLSCNYIFHFLSIWFNVAFLTDVYISTCRPSKAKEMCTVIRSKFVITGLTVLAIVMFMHVTWMSGVIQGMCMLLVPYDPELAFIDKIQTVVTILMPDLTLVILIALIVKKKVSDLCPSFRQSANSVSNGCGQVRTHYVRNTPADGASLGTQMANSVHSSDMTIVAMCLVLLHVVTTLPDHCIKLWFYSLQMVYGDMGFQPSPYEYSLQKLFSHLGQLRFVLNFVMFIIVSSDFQTAIRDSVSLICKRLFKCSPRRKRAPRCTDGRVIEESFSLTDETVSKSTTGDVKHADVEV